MWRPAVRGPTKIWHPWSATGLHGKKNKDTGLHEHKYVSKECQDLLEALEKEAEEQGRTHEIANHNSGETLDCKEYEQACTVEFDLYGQSISGSKCFPAICKEENIFKTIEENLGTLPAAAHFSGLEVSCEEASAPAPCLAAGEGCWEDQICRKGVIEESQNSNCRRQECNGGCAEGLVCDWSSGFWGVCVSETSCVVEYDECWEGQICRKGVKEHNPDWSCRSQDCNGGCAQGLFCSWSGSSRFLGGRWSYDGVGKCVS